MSANQAVSPPYTTQPAKACSVPEGYQLRLRLHAVGSRLTRRANWQIQPFKRNLGRKMWNVILKGTGSQNFKKNLRRKMWNIALEGTANQNFKKNLGRKTWNIILKGAGNQN